VKVSVDGRELIAVKSQFSTGGGTRKNAKGIMCEDPTLAAQQKRSDRTRIRVMNFTLFRLSKFLLATISNLKKRRRACEILFVREPWANTRFMVRDGAEKARQNPPG
jgi:hypothetical protein